MTPKLNAIGLVVADMPAAVAFYRRLGLEFASDSEQHEECELAGGMKLMLDAEELVRSLVPDWSPPSGGPGAVLAFEFDDPKAVDAMFAELVAAGFRGALVPFDAFWGHRYASVLDPDGNGVDLYATLPATPS